MAVSCFAGAFNTGTGAVSTTLDVTPTGCTISGASAVVFWMNGRTESVDTLGRATYFWGAGFAVSATDRRATVAEGIDANAAHDGGTYSSNAACILSDTLESAIDGAMDFDSWLSNGFRLIVDDVMPRDYRVGYFLITGLTNAESVNYLTKTTTGNQNITNTGNFQPDAAIFIDTANDNVLPAGRNGASLLGLGFAVSSSQQATYSGGEDEASATSDTDSYCLDGVECLSMHSTALGTSVIDRQAFVAWLSNGVTLNQLEVPSTQNNCFVLFLKGGSYKVTSVLTQTDTTTDINTPSLGFTPAGVLLFSAYKAEHTQDIPTVHNTWTMGAAHGTANRVAFSLRDEDGLADTKISIGVEHDEIYQSIDVNHAVDGLMDVKTWADPITFIMDDADPSQKFVPMLVIGNAAAQEFVPRQQPYPNLLPF